MRQIFILCAVFLTTAGFCFSQASDTAAIPERDLMQEGIASWYGAEFEGKPTASGETFRSEKLTAAHPVLPFGTLVKVTNLHNQNTVTVTINDRGPFVASRIIDVSRAAAEKLDMIITGTAPVKIEVLSDEGSIPEEVVPVPINLIPALPDPGNGKIYRLQVGSYVQTKNALDAFERLEAQGLNPAYERYNDKYRVVLAGIASGQVSDMVKKLALAGFSEILIKEER